MLVLSFTGSTRVVNDETGSNRHLSSAHCCPRISSGGLGLEPYHHRGAPFNIPHEERPSPRLLLCSRYWVPHPMARSAGIAPSLASGMDSIDCCLGRVAGLPCVVAAPADPGGIGLSSNPKAGYRLR